MMRGVKGSSKKAPGSKGGLRRFDVLALIVGVSGEVLVILVLVEAASGVK
jgi:hypothetical protein